MERNLVGVAFVGAEARREDAAGREHDELGGELEAERQPEPEQEACVAGLDRGLRALALDRPSSTSTTTSAMVETDVATPAPAAPHCTTPSTSGRSAARLNRFATAEPIGGGRVSW